MIITSKSTSTALKKLRKKNIHYVTPTNLKPSSDFYKEHKELKTLFQYVLRTGGRPLWENAPLMGQYLLNKLATFNVKFVVLTAPPSGEYGPAYTGKQNWVEANLRPVLGNKLVGFICTEDKNLFSAENSLLIDDREKNTKNFSNSILVTNELDVGSIELPQEIEIVYLDLDGCFANLHQEVAPRINKILERANIDV